MSETSTHLSVTIAESPAPLQVAPAVNAYTRVGKRAFDLVAGLLLGALFLPLALLIALAIRIGLGNGVLYSQQRIGHEGRTFTIWKFRTMRHDRRQRQLPAVEMERRSSHKDDADPRHTGLGRHLRRMSLDELPQLWNVIRGDMSLVGPRPEVVDVALSRGYADHVRNSVRPGLTGPYQLSALRANGDLRDGLALDSAYVQDVTFTNDVLYLLRTLKVLMSRRCNGT